MHKPQAYGIIFLMASPRFSVAVGVASPGKMYSSKKMCFYHANGCYQDGMF